MSLSSQSPALVLTWSLVCTVVAARRVYCVLLLCVNLPISFS